MAKFLIAFALIAMIVIAQANPRPQSTFDLIGQIVGEVARAPGGSAGLGAGLSIGANPGAASNAGAGLSIGANPGAASNAGAGLSIGANPGAASNAGAAAADQRSALAGIPIIG